MFNFDIAYISKKINNDLFFVTNNKRNTLDSFYRIFCWFFMCMCFFYGMKEDQKKKEQSIETVATHTS